MLMTGYSISAKDLGTAGVLPVARGDGGLVPPGGLAWVFPLSTSGLIPAGGGLPDFSRLSPRDLAELRVTWDVVAARSIDLAGREVLDKISAAFTPWVKDLIRWAARSHHDLATRAHYVVIRNSAAFAQHDASFLVNP